LTAPTATERRVLLLAERWVYARVHQLPRKTLLDAERALAIAVERMQAERTSLAGAVDRAAE
jgi:hypothetical protein